MPSQRLPVLTCINSLLLYRGRQITLCLIIQAKLAPCIPKQPQSLSWQFSWLFWVNIVPFTSLRGWAVAGWQDGGSHIFRSIRLVKRVSALHRGGQPGQSRLSFSPSPWSSCAGNSGECRLVWGSLCPSKLHEALLHLQHPWEHQQQQRQGDRHQENQRRHLSSGGGSQGVSQSAQGDMPPTPLILARGAASKESGEEKNKSSLPQKINWKEGARRCCFVLPYLAAGTNTCLVSRYTWQIKENSMLPAATLQFCGTHQFFILSSHPFD